MMRGFAVSNDEDWRVEMARLVLAPQVAGMAIMAIMIAFVFYPFVKAVSEIPNSLNRLTQQVERVDITLSKHAALLEAIDKKVNKEQRG